MAESNFHGPVTSMGALEDNRSEPMDGPIIVYQGKVVADPRFGPFQKDGTAPARVRGFMNQFDVVVVDAIPQAASTTLLVAATVATSATSWSINTTSAAGIAGSQAMCAGIPIVPLGTTTIVRVTALDFGFATGTTVAASSTVVVQDATLFKQAQWIIIGGAGASNASPVITQVQSALVNATTIQVLPAPAASLSNAPIGQANLYGSGLLPPATQFGPSSPVATAANPYIDGGLAAIFDPRQGVARNISVTCSTATNGTAQVIVSGYDIYGAPMTELITASGTTTIFGNKAFKYISTIIPQQTQGGSFVVGVGDMFGFNIRCDKWEYTSASYNGLMATSKNGWTAAFTGVASNTTGDVRGTYQISANGTLGTSISGTVTNNTSRLVMFLSVPLFNAINATPTTSTSLFGVAQA